MGHAERERAAGEMLREALRERQAANGHTPRRPAPCRVCWGCGYCWRRKWVEWLQTFEWTTSLRDVCESCEGSGREMPTMSEG